MKTNRLQQQHRNRQMVANYFLLPGMGATPEMYDSLKRELSIDIHYLNWPHSGEGKQPLPATIYLGPAMWGMAMIACGLALVVHGTMVYYADRSYDAFSRMAPVYPNARPIENGFGLSTSLDQEIAIVEYVFTDSWKDVTDYYAKESNPNGWHLYDKRDNRHILLEHRNGNSLFISWSEPARYKEKGQKILQYFLHRKNPESKEMKSILD